MQGEVANIIPNKIILSIITMKYSVQKNLTHIFILVKKIGTQMRNVEHYQTFHLNI